MTEDEKLSNLELQTLAVDMFSVKRLVRGQSRTEVLLIASRFGQLFVMFDRGLKEQVR